MVIEHRFVTTLPSNEALLMASEFLSRGGFHADIQSAFQVVGQEWTTLQMHRGRKTSSRAKNPVECPQQIRLEWDRGLINVAVSIEPRASRNRTFLWGNLLGAGSSVSSGSYKKTKIYSDLLIAISRGLELLLVKRVTPVEAGREWFALEIDLKAHAQKERRRSLIFAAIFLVLVVAAIISIVVATMK